MSGDVLADAVAGGEGARGLEQQVRIGVHDDLRGGAARDDHVVAAPADGGAAEIAEHVGALQVQRRAQHAGEAPVRSVHGHGHDDRRLPRAPGEKGRRDRGLARVAHAAEVVAVGNARRPLGGRVDRHDGAVGRGQRGVVEHRAQVLVPEKALLSRGVREALRAEFAGRARQGRQMDAELVVEVGRGAVGQRLLLLAHQFDVLAGQAAVLPPARHADQHEHQ